MKLNLFLVLTMVFSPGGTGRHVTAPCAQSRSTNVEISDGLLRLLNDLLAIAKSGDATRLSALVAEMEIPNYESWFLKTVGTQEGQKRTALYAKSLPASELQFQMLLTELARQDGKISIERTDSSKKYGAYASALDEYKATWKKTDTSIGPNSQQIGLFYFIDGKFRLDASGHEVRILSPNAGGSLAPAKLVTKVQPLYPPQARALGIQRVVSINVIVRKDGAVEVENIGAGNPLLAPAAEDAVRQWRYQPTTVGGQPVDTETKVYVTFSLNNKRLEP